MKSKDEYKIRRWLGDRYLLNTEITFKEDKTKIESWKLFRVYPGWMKDNSEAIMTSETHTDKDLMKFAKKHRKYDLSMVEDKIFIIISWTNVAFSILNAYFHSTFIRGFNWGIILCLFIILITKMIFMIYNEKIEDKEFEEKMKLLEEKLKKRILKIEKQNIFKKAIINKKVEHQNIGGKEIILEKELMVKDLLDTNFNEMPVAMINFIKRRLDFIDEKNEDKKVYYGHIGDFGYFVAEDEIEMIKDERESDTRKSN